jgi:hypothetical protein
MFYCSFFYPFQGTCIGLPQKVNKALCPLKRRLHLWEQNWFYKLTTPRRNPLAYPNQTKNLMEAVPFPLLNRGSVAIIIRSAFKSELSERGWLIRYLGMASRNRNLAKKSSESNCTTYANYAQLLTRFRNKESKSLIEASFKLPFLVSKLLNINI